MNVMFLLIFFLLREKNGTAHLRFKLINIKNKWIWYSIYKKLEYINKHITILYNTDYSFDCQYKSFENRIYICSTTNLNFEHW